MRRIMSSRACRRLTHSVSICTVCTPAEAASACFSASVPSGRAGGQRRGDHQGVGQGIVGQGVERLAEARTRLEFRQCLVGGNDAHVGDIGTGAKLLGQGLDPRGRAFLSRYTENRRLDSSPRWRCAGFAEHSSRNSGSARATAMTAMVIRVANGLLTMRPKRAQQGLRVPRQPGVDFMANCRLAWAKYSFARANSPVRGGHDASFPRTMRRAPN
jgi:hypothetical protein